MVISFSFNVISKLDMCTFMRIFNGPQKGGHDHYTFITEGSSMPTFILRISWVGILDISESPSRK